MKKTLSCLVLLTAGLTWAGAQDATTTVQVAPSDQVIYPDASDILNKTPPKAATEKTAPASTRPAQGALPSLKPVVGSVPVPAKPGAVPAKPAVAAGAPVHGWFLRWTVTGDEAGVRAWAASVNGTLVTNLGPGLWEVLAGPVATDGLDQALKAQAGKAQLVKR